MSQADIPGAAAQTSTESQLWRRWESNPRAIPGDDEATA